MAIPGRRIGPAPGEAPPTGEESEIGSVGWPSTGVRSRLLADLPVWPQPGRCAIRPSARRRVDVGCGALCGERLLPYPARGGPEHKTQPSPATCAAPGANARFLHLRAVGHDTARCGPDIDCVHPMVLFLVAWVLISSRLAGAACVVQRGQAPRPVCAVSGGRARHNGHIACAQSTRTSRRGSRASRPRASTRCRHGNRDEAHTAKQVVEQRGREESRRDRVLRRVCGEGRQLLVEVVSYCCPAGTETTAGGT
jgi:hypothetical protein